MSELWEGFCNPATPREKRELEQKRAAPTIAEEIERYKAMTDDDKKLLRAMFNALADLRCPHCHKRISTTIET